MPFKCYCFAHFFCFVLLPPYVDVVGIVFFFFTLSFRFNKRAKKATNSLDVAFFYWNFFIAITCKHLRQFKWKVSKREWKRWNTGVKISYEREAIVIALSHAYSWKINKAIYVKKVLKTLSKKNLGLHLECLYTHILLVRAFKCSQQIKWRHPNNFVRENGLLSPYQYTAYYKL